MFCCWALFVQPGLQMINEDEIMQKDDTKGQAGYAADSSTKDDITSDSQLNAKPPVVGSPLLSDETSTQKILRQVRDMMSADPNWIDKRAIMFNQTYKSLSTEFQLP